MHAGRALALLRGRDYVLPEDVSELVPDVLRHRLVLSYQALAEGASAEEIIGALLRKIRPPATPLAARSFAPAGANNGVPLQ